MAMDASLQNVGSTTTTTSELPKLISTNSFELNAGTSLSDDSGFAPTNSSRFENGSDAEELSQFDSSDSGLSAENFNTLKKIPTTIYDPPPEFQDNYKYPQTTVLRTSSYIQSYAQRLTQNIISKAITSLANTRRNPVYCLKHSKSKKSLQQKTSGQEHLARKKFMNNNNFNIYGSDSFLNSYNKMNNSLSNNANSNSNINRIDPDYEIYDEPNTEYDVIYKDNKNTVLCTKRIVRSLEKKPDSRSHLYSNTDELHCNNVKSNSCHNNQNYNLTNNIQSNSFQKKFDKFLRSKFLTTNLTPTTTTSSILYSYCHAAGTNLSSGNPNSRNSLNSRLSSSHNSLTVTTANKADDSIFITQAMSHDALQLGHHIEISDFYNVPIDSDIYTLPIDVINQPQSTDDKEHHPHHPHQQQQEQKSRAMSDNSLLNSSNRSHKIHRSKNKRSKRKKRTDNVNKDVHNNLEGQSTHQTRSKIYRNAKSKRFSVPENSHTSMNLSLDEVKKYYNNLYSTSSESVSDVVNFSTRKPSSSNLKHVTNTQTFSANKKTFVANKTKSKSVISTKSGAIAKEDIGGGGGHTKKEQNETTETLSPRFIKGDKNNNNNNNNSSSKYGSNSNVKKSQFSISLNLKQKFCSIFRFKKSQHTTTCITNSNAPPVAQVVPTQNEPEQLLNDSNNSVDKKVKLSTRALPPLPAGLCKYYSLQCLLIDNYINYFSDDREDVIEPNEASNSPIMDKKRENTMDFAANIEKVREYGWYWGPLSSDGAEKILSNEPDGSFIVRDSSDLNYIFSLTFKLNGCVRHVRIEQDQGTFSFGSCALFKSRTIMEFIENAVENSRSGRYLFFLHRRPEHGPMRVQLTNPVSRFKHIQSLQHMCRYGALIFHLIRLLSNDLICFRFVILKAVMRKDLIDTLPLPRRILDYLSNKNFLSEQIESDSSQSQVSSMNINM
ncbi:unnamed protein product [Diamesa serratosioi]